VSFDRCMDDFLTATRSLFNGYFREANPVARFDRALTRHEFYSEVETSLFRALVILPCELMEIPYGEENQQILIRPNGEFDLPVMLNRDLDSGYWDYPLERMPRDARIHFQEFFDWDLVGRKDNRYVRAVVAAAPHNPEIVGKHCLIETHYVTFALDEVDEPQGPSIAPAPGRV